MDAIIFFYSKRRLIQPKTEFLYRDGYLLVRVGLCALPERWFAGQFPAEIPISTEGRISWQNLSARLRMRKRIRINRQITAELESKIAGFAQKLTRAVETVEGMIEIYSVYGRGLEFLTYEERDLSSVGRLWNQYWEIREFTGYADMEWARLILKQAIGPYFVLLGNAQSVPGIVHRLSRRMKSLDWYVFREEYDEADALCLELNREYGLAVNLQTFARGQNSGNPKVKLEHINCVLDFLPQDCTFAYELSDNALSENIVWLDFASVDEKERRFIREKTPVQYISLKKMWRNYE